MTVVSGRTITKDLLASELWRVPPLPGTLARLLEVAHDEAAGSDDVARAVALDEVLAAHVLRAANSALLGLRTSVNTVQQAVGRVGCSTVLSLAVAQAMSDAAPLAHSLGGVPRVSYWEHNWAVATATAYLGKAVGTRPAEAHLAGLLHDLGKLLLASREPWRYEECVIEAAASGEALQEVEVARLGIDHSAAGAAALTAWKMPELTVLAAELHHEPLTAATPPIAALVAASNALAHEAGFGDSGNGVWPSLWGGAPVHPKVPEGLLRRCQDHLEQQRRWVGEIALQFAEVG